MSSTMLYLHTLSPLHCGTGQGSGIIDLPVARERVTNWPEVPGSTVKGVLRDACREAKVDPEAIKVVFGPDIDNQQDNPSERAGGVWSASGQLLCFPVRSFRGTFAWVTCPIALGRWLRDYESLGQSLALALPAPPDDATILTVPAAKEKLAVNDWVLLEDFDLGANVEQDATIAAIAGQIARAVFPDDATWQEFFTTHFGVVSDDLFGFLTRTATDVRARIRIDDKRKIVADGQLWYEETVPVETIFTMPLRATRQGEERLAERAPEYARQIDVIRAGTGGPIQVGGNASVGSGLVWARLDLTTGDTGASGEEAGA